MPDEYWVIFVILSYAGTTFGSIGITSLVIFCHYHVIFGCTFGGSDKWWSDPSKTPFYSYSYVFGTPSLIPLIWDGQFRPLFDYLVIFGAFCLF